MKKIILASTIALMAVIAVPAQAALNDQPWRYTGYSYVRVGNSVTIKACHWVKYLYENGIFQAKMNTTYTSRYGNCPAPVVP